MPYHAHVGELVAVIVIVGEVELVLLHFACALFLEAAHHLLVMTQFLRNKTR